MKEFVIFGTDHQSMYFISTEFLKDKTNQVSYPQFQLAYICDKNNPSQKNLVKLCREAHCVWWRHQDLELQECYDCITSNKKTLSIIM